MKFIFKILLDILKFICNFLQYIIQQIERSWDFITDKKANFILFVSILILYIITFLTLDDGYYYLVIESFISKNIISAISNIFDYLLQIINLKPIDITGISLLIVIFIGIFFMIYIIKKYWDIYNLRKKIFYINESKFKEEKNDYTTLDKIIEKFESLLEIYNNAENQLLSGDVKPNFYSLSFITRLFYPKKLLNYDLGRLYLEKIKYSDESIKNDLLKAIEKFNDVIINPGFAEKNKAYEYLGDTYTELAKYYSDKPEKKEKEFNFYLAIEFYSKQENFYDENSYELTSLQEKEGDAFLVLVNDAFNIDKAITQYQQANSKYKSLAEKKNKFALDKEKKRILNLKAGRTYAKIALAYLNYIEHNADNPDNKRRFEGAKQSLDMAHKLFVTQEFLCGYSITNKLLGDYYKLYAKQAEAAEAAAEPQENLKHSIACYEEAKKCCAERQNQCCKNNKDLICSGWLKIDIQKLDGKICDVLIELSKYEEKKANLNKAIGILEKTEKTTKLKKMAEIYIQSAEVNDSIECIEKAINIYKNLIAKFTKNNELVIESLDFKGISTDQNSLGVEVIDIEKYSLNKEEIQTDCLLDYTEINYLLGNAYITLANYVDPKSNCNKALSVLAKLKKELVLLEDEIKIDYEIKVLKDTSEAYRLLYKHYMLDTDFNNAIFNINAAKECFNQKYKYLSDDQKYKDKVFLEIKEVENKILIKYIELYKDIKPEEMQKVNRGEAFNFIEVKFSKNNYLLDDLQNILKDLKLIKKSYQDLKNFYKVNWVIFYIAKIRLFISEITIDDSDIEEIKSLLSELKSKSKDNNNYLYLLVIQKQGYLFKLHSKIEKSSSATKRHLIESAIDLYKKALNNFTIAEYPVLFAIIKNEIGYSCILKIKYLLDIDHPSDDTQKSMESAYSEAIDIFNDNLVFFKPDEYNIHFLKTMCMRGLAHVLMFHIYIKIHKACKNSYFYDGISEINKVLESIDWDKFKNSWTFKNLQIYIANSFFYTQKMLNFSREYQIINDLKGIKLIDDSIKFYEEQIDWFDKKFSFVYIDLNHKLGFCFLEKYKINKNFNDLNQAKTCYSDAQDCINKLKNNKAQFKQLISIDFDNEHNSISQYKVDNSFYLGYIYSLICGIESFKANINQAAYYNKIALSNKIINEDNCPHLYAKICNNLGDANHKLFRLTWKKEYFEEAKKWYTNALAEYTPEKHFDDNIFVNLNMIYLFLDFAEYKDFKENIKRAEEKIKNNVDKPLNKVKKEKFNYWLLSSKLLADNLKLKFENQKDINITDKDPKLKQELLEDFLDAGDSQEIKYRLQLANYYRSKILGSEDKDKLKNYEQAKKYYDIAEKLIENNGKEFEHDDVHYFDILYNKSALYLKAKELKDTEPVNKLNETESLLDKIKQLYKPISDYPVFELKLKFIETIIEIEHIMDCLDSNNKENKDDKEQQKEKHIYKLFTLDDQIKVDLYKKFDDIPIYFKIQEIALRAIVYWISTELAKGEKGEKYIFKQSKAFFRNALYLSSNDEFPNMHESIKKLLDVLKDKKIPSINEYYKEFLRNIIMCIF